MTTFTNCASTPSRWLLISVGVLLFGGCSQRTENSNTQRSKEIVLAFYKLGLQDFKLQEAFDRYVTPDYTEHAADSADGTMQSSINFLANLMKQSPGPKFEIVRTIAEDDLVFLHVRVTIAGGPPVALGDIFRVQNDRIVEHWDLVQQPREHPTNPNSVF